MSNGMQTALEVLLWFVVAGVGATILLFIVMVPIILKRNRKIEREIENMQKNPFGNRRVR